MLHVLGQVATTMRSKLGESLVSVHKFDTPLEQVTTSSLEALQAYSEGLKVAKEKGSSEALPFFRHAVELDPNFAAAYVELGNIYAEFNQVTLTEESLKRAFELKERVSQREKFSIASNYYSLVTGEMEKANHQYDLWIREYPREMNAHANLGLTTAILGQIEKAIREYQETLKLEPSSSGFSNLAQLYMCLNRFDQAKATIDEALQRKARVGPTFITQCIARISSERH